MDDNRPPKRLRTVRHDVYHDPVPVFEDFNMIVSTEGRLLRQGNTVLAAPPIRSSEPVLGAWDRVVDWEPVDDPEYALDPDGNWYDEAVEAEVIPVTEKTKAKRSRRSKRPHVVWMENHRQSYLDEIMRSAGRGDFQAASECPDCKARGLRPPNSPQYRCEDCFTPDLVCQVCCVKRHRSQPLHWIQRWTGSHFERTSLRSLGLKVQLNHSGLYCETPVPSHANLLVLHTNGIHSVNIQYCGCHRKIPQDVQLLRRRLYPASQLKVKTCATFALLREVQKLAWATKASTYDFYRSLEKLTCNTGLNVPKSRYKAFSRMLLQWKHLQMLKWAGRGNNASGAAGTAPGELAVQCPSCPHPGINLLPGWQSASKELRFLYTVILCMDANFRLKNQVVSNYSQDPGLGTGWAYMVPRKPYEAYVLSKANDEDISTCVGFQALAKANTKFSTGLRYTGVNVVVCGRSEMIMPLGVGNLQKGERYANMDYVFGLVLRAIAVTLVVISYDIACQWFVNLFKRMEESWPEEIRPLTPKTLIPAIPKLHEPMHHSAGHECFSFNFLFGAGETDGECPERVWSPHNALGNSTKTQGPGSRQDVLDDHFGFWNWQKYISLGRTLLRRYRAAVALRNLQNEGHRGLTATVHPVVVKEWEVMCKEWEEEIYPKTNPSPYRAEGATMSEAQAKKELAEEETRRVRAGGAVLHPTSPQDFIVMGLEVEESQRRVRRQAKVAKGDVLKEHRNSLLASLQAWEQLLPIYIPGLLSYKLDHPVDPPSEHPEDAVLWLPSQLPPSHRRQACMEGLPDIEEKLRTAQCSDSLDDIRRILRIKSRMIQFKNKNLRGQRDGTRSRAMIDRVHERARSSAEKYRCARASLLKLSGPGPWEERFRVLADSDIRGFQDANKLQPKKGRPGTLEDDQALMVEEEAEVLVDEEELVLFEEERGRRDGTGESRRTLSWIWTAPTSTPANASDRNTAESLPSTATQRPTDSSTAAASPSDSSSPNEEHFETGEDYIAPQHGNQRLTKEQLAELDARWQKKDRADHVLRGEWAKSRARTKRATEEVLLLKEEMGRVLRYLEWRAAWWKRVEDGRPDEPMVLREGIQAVAAKNSALQQSLCSAFRNLWKSPLTEPSPSLNQKSTAQNDKEREGDDNKENGEKSDDNDSEDEEEGDDEEEDEEEQDI